MYDTPCPYISFIKIKVPITLFWVGEGHQLNLRHLQHNMSYMDFKVQSGFQHLLSARQSAVILGYWL